MLATLLTVFLGAIILGVPIALGLGVASLVSILFASPLPPSVVVTRLFASVDSATLLAIPFFILAGELMNTGGMTERIIRFATTLVGHIRGGLGQVNVLTSVFFAGMQGSATADASAVGSMLIPGMIRAGWRKRSAVAITASSSLIGPLLPPSMMFILYGVMANVSITRLFYAGIVPGLLVAAALMITVWITSSNEGRTPRRAARAEIWLSLRQSALAWGLPVLVLGGLRVGAFTPTEGGALAAVYAFVIGKWVYRTIAWSDLPRIFRNAAITASTAGFLLATAGLFGWILTWEGFAETLKDLITSVAHSPLVFTLLLVGMTVLIGLVFEGIPYLVLITPMIMPSVHAYGLDPVHFGVILTLAVMIGSITPPVGILTYISCKIAGIGVSEATPALVPYVVALIAVLLLLTLFPSLVLAVPTWFLGS